MMISHSVLRMRNVSVKSWRENQNTHLLSVHIFRKSCRLWDNVGKYVRAWQVINDHANRRLRFAFWITKATDTEYAVLIASPRQRWFRKRATVLRLHVYFLSCNMPLGRWECLDPVILYFITSRRYPVLLFWQEWSFCVSYWHPIHITKLSSFSGSLVWAFSPLAISRRLYFFHRAWGGSLACMFFASQCL